MTRRVEISPVLRAAIMAQARAAHPLECCGLLKGVGSDVGWRILALHLAANLSGHHHAFEIDPADHIAAQKAARIDGHAVIGCYHSHPDGRAQPSAADLAGATQEDFIWLIAAGETLNAFVYFRGRFTGADCVTSES